MTSVRTDLRQVQFAAVEPFLERPKKWTFVEVTDVDVDADDNLYVFNRSPRPVMIFDKNGAFLDSWGEMSEQYFTKPHSLTVGPDGAVYTTDTGDHTVRKWTPEGKLLLRLGRTNINSPTHSGEPFNRPTHCSVTSDGKMYISDGYGNARIHCFNEDGELEFSWGSRGGAAGEFDTPHSVFVDEVDARICVADRYNNRVQFFTYAGEFIAEWTGLHMPNDVYRGSDDLFYVAELEHRVSVFTADGELVAQWGDGVQVDDSETGGGGIQQLALPTAPSRHPMLRGKVRVEPGAGQFCAPHGIAVDSAGTFYVGEVCESYCGLDRGNRCLQKFVRVAAEDSH
jgi:DNA-binding beta-propeller fold protein YncE